MKSYYFGLALKILLLVACIVGLFLMLDTVGYRIFAAAGTTTANVNMKNILIELMDNYLKTLSLTGARLERERTELTDKMKTTPDRAERQRLEKELRDVESKNREIDAARSGLEREKENLERSLKEKAVRFENTARETQQRDEELRQARFVRDEYADAIKKEFLARAKTSEEKANIEKAFGDDHGLAYIKAFIRECGANGPVAETSKTTVAPTVTPKTTAATLPPATNSPQAGFTDDFNGPRLDSRWQWVRERPANWSLKDRPGFLSITTESGDLWGNHNSNKNMLLTDAVGADFTITTRIEFSPTANHQQAGLVIYQNDDNYIRLTNVYSDGNKLQLVYEKTAGPIYQEMNTNNSRSMYLRLTKKGVAYTGFSSFDGKQYNFIFTCTGTLENKLKVGLIAFDDIATIAITARFDNFSLTSP
jgi:regulation of enolase protein 1 (concanavalin A-like superfamily)